MTVKFNETVYSNNAKDSIAAELLSSLTTGWVTTGAVTAEVESRVATLCNKKLAVGTLMAPFFPLAAALKHTFKSKNVVAIQATAWPEHVAAFLQYGFTVKLFDLGDCNPSFGLNHKKVPADANFVFVLDMHGSSAHDLRKFATDCKNNGQLLIHDISYGFYAKDSEGPTREIGDIVTMSLNPGKLVTGLNGGMTALNNPLIADHLKMARLDGLIQATKLCEIGVGDWRMLEVQAATLSASLDDAPDLISMRKIIAMDYDRAVQANSWLAKHNSVPQSDTSGMDRYVLRFEEGWKPSIQLKLIELGIEQPKLTYDYPAIEHPYVASHPKVSSSSMPLAAKWCRSFVLLPCHNKLSGADVRYVVDVIRGLTNASLAA